ncbi:MAG TPA: hypothetical protein VK470_01970 [Bacteroidota bacterium]|nr:hypothetical protein [Bacteroidota bacterium]
MKRRICVGLCLCLLWYCAVASAQQIEPSQTFPRSFLGTLSAEVTASRIYDRSHGYTMGARAVLPLFAVPAFGGGERNAAELALLPGIKYGSILIPNDEDHSAVLYLAPELSLHYSFLQTRTLGAYAGPSAEFILTNNFRSYKLVSTAGIDLGLTFALASYASLGIEHRWIVTRERIGADNRAGFPSTTFPQIGLVLRFSLPWKSAQDSREAFVRDDDSRRALADAAAALQRQRHAEELRSAQQQQRADSLSDELHAFASKLKELEQYRRNDSLAKTNHLLDPYNQSLIAGDREYRFTKDPFRAGDLVNDKYLKDVLIDILDDGYVWQLSARKARMADAEKIRKFFILYRSAYNRRIAIVEDERTPLFTLKCLGRAESSTGQKNK